MLKAFCDKGGRTRCRDLALIYLKEKKINEARELLQKGCDGYYAMSCHVLGDLEKELGNLAKTKDAYQKGCDANIMKVCNELGNLIKKEDKTLAEILYERACRNDLAIACTNLGAIQLDRGEKKLGSTNILKGCKGGDKRACHFIDKVIAKTKRK